MKGGVRKRGNNWYYYFDAGKINGKRRKIERKGGRTKKEAEFALRQAIGEYESSGYTGKQCDITYYDFVEIWYNECTANLSYGTRKDYWNVIKNHIRKHKISYMKLKDIQPEDLQKYVDEKSKQLSQMKGQFVVLNKSFKYAVYPKKYIKENPMQYVEKRTDNKDVDTFVVNENKIESLTLEEYSKLIGIFHNSIYELPTQISFYTGLREGEVCGIFATDVDNDRINVTKKMYYNADTKCWELGPTKGKKSRMIDIGPSLITLIKEERIKKMRNRLQYGEYYNRTFLQKVEIDRRNHIQIISANQLEIDAHKEYFVRLTPVEFLCVKDDGTPITCQTLKYSNKIIQRKYAKSFSEKDKLLYPALEHYHFHMLRHTHATIALQNNAKITDVSERLGHSRTSITMDIYSHTTAKSRKDTSDIFEQAATNLPPSF